MYLPDNKELDKILNRADDFQIFSDSGEIARSADRSPTIKGKVRVMLTVKNGSYQALQKGDDSGQK